MASYSVVGRCDQVDEDGLKLVKVKLVDVLEMQAR
jgi:hypothetical protein